MSTDTYSSLFGSADGSRVQWSCDTSPKLESFGFLINNLQSELKFNWGSAEVVALTPADACVTPVVLKDLIELYICEMTAVNINPPASTQMMATTVKACFQMIQ